VSFSLGIDIGGTFTDLVLSGSAGERHALKVLTTPDDPSRAVVEGVRTLLGQSKVAAKGIARVVHATTLFTNALIERKGALTGLITTAGFRDVLEIGRERRFELYDLNIRMPEPLVPRDLRLEVAERTAADGSIGTAVDEAELQRAGASLAAAGVASIAVVFLNSYANPQNEQRAAAALRKAFPKIALTASHEIVPEVREFERSSTAAANAYVKPLAAHYLEGIRDKLGALGIGAPLSLMLSSGGFTHIAEAKASPVHLLESGPAAGALAAAHLGKGEARLLAFDMGGTTAKLCIVDDGIPLVAQGFEAGRTRRFMEGSGLPIRVPSVDLIEIGAGGGSIAHPDSIGLLKVGPQSAGSVPGPACYGLGGTEPTVTDANLALGVLNPDYFAGGTIKIGKAKAESAVEGLGKRLGLSMLDTAWGIVNVVNENMASAARVHIAERGRDQRAYVLLVTGGGGPVHGYQVAKKLGLTRMICPPSAGVASAFGLITAPARVDRVATVGLKLDGADLESLEARFRALEEEAFATLEQTGARRADAILERNADGRFVGQGFYLSVPLPRGPYTDRQVLRAAFEKGYREKFTHTPPQVTVEFVNIRVTATAPAPAQASNTQAGHATARAAAPDSRKVYFKEAGGKVDTAVYRRENLAAGFTAVGPLLVEEEGSTLVIPPGGRVTLAADGNLIVEVT
jgi:N-methylhydantoinase A